MMIIIAAETEHVIHQNPDQDLMKEVFKKWFKYLKLPFFSNLSYLFLGRRSYSRD